MSLPAALPIVTYAGDQWQRRVTITDGTDPIDLTGETFTSHIRPRGGDPTDEPLVELDIDTTDADTGVIVITLAAEDNTTDLDGTVWDLEHTSAQRTLLAGAVTVHAEVTQ